jgi:recombinational DNA repair protein RecT
MNQLQENIQAKKNVLKETITEIKSFSIEINEDLEMDKKKREKIFVAYEHSGSLLQRTNKEIDKLLNQSEVRIAIYVGGVGVMIFTIIWKFFFN